MHCLAIAFAVKLCISMHLAELFRRQRIGLCINMMHAVASPLLNVSVCIMQSYFAFGEYILTLRLTSELVDLRVGYAKRIQELRS